MEISNEIKVKIANANKANSYVDVTPYELEIGFPIVSYIGFHPRANEILIYAAPAFTFKDKEQVVGYTGKSSGINIRMAKGVSLRTNSSGGRPIRNEVRKFNNGDLLITNQRVLFIGKDDSFEFNIDKISTLKIIDNQSFVLQAGRLSKNICLNSVLVHYAYGFINYVIKEKNAGIDIYSSILDGQSKITREQQELCDRVRVETTQIKNSTKKKTSPTFIVLLIFILLLVIGIVASTGNISSNNSTNEISNTVVSTYTDSEILSLDGHPVIYDSFENVKSFYENNSRVKVTDTYNYTVIQQKKKEVTDDDYLMYMICDPTSKNYFGYTHINLFDEDICKDITPKSALTILVSYLPSNFNKYYKKDAAYFYENGEVTTYVYANRLNDDGMKYQDDGNSQYSYYYSLYVIHLKDSNKWILKTNYSAFGDKDLGWIEKYADKWNVSL